MATQSTTTPKSKTTSTKSRSTSTRTQAKRTKTNTKRAANSAGRTAQAAAPEKSQVQRVVETVVDVPVGAALGFGERVTELVDPFTGRTTAEKQLRSYRTQLRRNVKRAERRGATTRRKTTTRAKRVRSDVGKTLERQSDRAQEFVEQLGDQLPTLR